MSRLDAALERIQRWDERVCMRLNGALRYRSLPQACRAISRLGDGIFWYALMLALLLWRRDAAQGAVGEPDERLVVQDELAALQGRGHGGGQPVPRDVAGVALGVEDGPAGAVVGARVTGTVTVQHARGPLP